LPDRVYRYLFADLANLTFNKSVGEPVIKIKPVDGANPQTSLRIFKHRVYDVVIEAGAVFFVMSVFFERISVPAKNPLVRANPQKPKGILKNVCQIVGRESMFRRHIINI